LARAGVPQPSRRVALAKDAADSGKPFAPRFWPHSWKPAFVLGVTVAVVLVVTTLWWHPLRDRQRARWDRQWQEDQTLISDVQHLITEPLPPAYGFMAGEVAVDSDEAPWDWLVPGDDGMVPFKYDDLA